MPHVDEEKGDEFYEPRVDLRGKSSRPDGEKGVNSMNQGSIGQDIRLS